MCRAGMSFQRYDTTGNFSRATAAGVVYLFLITAGRGRQPEHGWHVSVACV